MSVLNKAKHALFVEGSDDLYVFANLLQKRWPGVVEGEQARVIRQPRPAKDGEDGAFGAAVAQFGSEVRAQKCERIGLVVDRDSPAQQRWKQLRRMLTQDFAFTTLPDEPATGGTLFGEGRARCGIWLMPDNTRDGALEELLLELAPVSSSLFQWASTASATAKSDHGAAFGDAALAKAALRTFLAWQEQPGVPPGEAIRRGWLQSTSTSADAFLAWFDRLFFQP